MIFLKRIIYLGFLHLIPFNDLFYIEQKYREKKSEKNLMAKNKQILLGFIVGPMIGAGFSVWSKGQEEGVLYFEMFNCYVYFFYATERNISKLYDLPLVEKMYNICHFLPSSLKKLQVEWEGIKIYKNALLF